MIETVYPVAFSDQKTIEKIVDDDQAMITHIFLPHEEAVPEHDSNSNVYLVIVRGQMTLRLGAQETEIYPSGRIIAVPYQTRMRISNGNEETLEFFVVKAPNPRVMQKENEQKKPGGA